MLRSAQIMGGKKIVVLYKTHKPQLLRLPNFSQIMGPLHSPKNSSEGDQALSELPVIWALLTIPVRGYKNLKNTHQLSHLLTHWWGWSALTKSTCQITVTQLCSLEKRVAIFLAYNLILWNGSGCPTSKVSEVSFSSGNWREEALAMW